MPPSGGHGEHQLDLLPRSEDHGADAGLKLPAPGPARNRDKTRCLDGLRGIACLIVFNYHFLWPWTPFIMLGYGALPPGAPEPYKSWFSLPIICLLNRGHPMVAIFFAISGYVLCRRILRFINERRLEAAYQSLASAAFTRIFRLYIPPLISMFIVAILAQVGVFRSNEDIYEGPDSAYINGTVATARYGGKCLNGTLPVLGATGLADSLGLESTDYLNTTIGPGKICLNASSELFSPASLYVLVDEFEKQASNKTRKKPKTLAPYATLDHFGDRAIWVQFGGSWEEHPFIHDNMTYAMQNFSRAYAEWANPFNFGHYHPRYDPHTFTIPMEFRGSMFIYVFLLATAALKAKWRLRFAGFLSAYSLTLGRWDMATFMGGTLLSELDIRSNFDPHAPARALLPLATHPMRDRHGGVQPPTRRESALRWMAIFLALFLLSYPDSGAEYTPGYSYLSEWVPKYYIPLSGWMFYQAMGALILLPCILRTPLLRGLLERPLAQYFGRISFSFYLVHGPVLHSLGFWIMPRLFERFGQAVGFVIGYVILLSVTLYLSGWWYRKIDTWSTTVGKRLEKALVDR